MNFHELTVGAYSKLRDRVSMNPEPPLVEFLGFEYKSESNDFIYSHQEQDFTRELVNSFNQFAYRLDRIKVWERVLSDYNTDDQAVLRYECTKLPFDYCLHFPYEFKSRLIFCATQLCYTRGVSAKVLTKADVASEDKINFSSLQKLAAFWIGVAPLLKALCEVDAEPYRKDTLNYRNKAQHRHGPRQIGRASCRERV